jgi:hypothetical protein
MPLSLFMCDHDYGIVRTIPFAGKLKKRIGIECINNGLKMTSFRRLTVKL